MMTWLRDLLRGYTDADMARVNRWIDRDELLPPQMLTRGEYWALVARYDRQR